MKALLIIDVQNDFCPGGALAVPQGDQVIPVINSLSPRFPVVAATQDWHPEGHVSFASTHGKSIGETHESTTGPQMLWPDHCVCGSDGAALHPELDEKNIRLILRKGMNPDIDSYSAFFENDRKTSTCLTSWLRAQGVGELFICGLATDYCVLYSCLDAISEGFEVSVIVDACRAVDVPPGSQHTAMQTMKERGAHIITSGELDVHHTLAD